MKLAIKSRPIGLYQFAERFRPENVLPSARIHYRSETVMAGAAARPLSFAIWLRLRVKAVMLVCVATDICRPLSDNEES
jgi:hypothetical protein